MKILVISHEYPPIGGGGGRIIQDLCEGMASPTNQFYILSSHHGDLPRLESQEFLTIERLHVRRDTAYRASLKSMFLFVMKSFFRSQQIMRIFKPDLIHAHFAVPGGASAALAAKCSSKPLVLTIHGGDVPGGAPEKTDRWFRFIKPFTGYIWRSASRIIAVSDASRQLALAHYPVNIKVIANGIDRSQFMKKNNNVSIPPKILFIGRFSPEKNAIAVPKILNKLSDLAYDCTMVGDGPQMDEVIETVQQFQLTKRVHLSGWLRQSQVNQELIESDILIMPSLRESMPMVGLQALAAGNALIMSNVGACPEMVDEGKNGYLIPINDIDAYASALRKLLESHEKLFDFKKRSQEKSAAFDIDDVLDKYRHVYQEVITR